MQRNFTIQRELVRNFTLTAGYVGTRGVHQPLRINIVQPTATPAGYVWPSPAGSGTLINPNFGQIRIMRWEGSSSYHGLQLNATQRFRYGIQFHAAYTWGKEYRHELVVDSRRRIHQWDVQSGGL
jgi:hypothetical protein